MKLPKELPKAIYLTDVDGEICHFGINPNWEVEKEEQPYTTSTGYIDSWTYEVLVDEEFPFITKTEDGEIFLNDNDKSHPFHKDHQKIEDSLTINLDKLTDKEFEEIMEMVEEKYEIAYT